MKSKYALAIAHLVVLAAIALQAAQAQTQPARTVTRDELRVCMNSEGELGARRTDLKTRNEKLREENAAIRAEAAQLAEDQQGLGQNQPKIDRFERRVKTHNARVKVAQDSADSLNKDVEALNSAMVAHNEKCGGISYSKEDKEAILKEREAAAK
jgi:hypothetical protein